MMKFEVTIKIKLSDRPDYDRIHSAMKNLGLCREGDLIGGTLRYTYAGETTVEGLLNLVAHAISPVQERFAVFVFDRQTRKSAGSVN